MWGFPKNRSTILGLPIIRTIVFWGLYWGPLFWGNYHVPQRIEGLGSDAVYLQAMLWALEACPLGFRKHLGLRNVGPGQGFGLCVGFEARGLLEISGSIGYICLLHHNSKRFVVV